MKRLLFKALGTKACDDSHESDIVAYFRLAFVIFTITVGTVSIVTNIMIFLFDLKHWSMH